MSSQTIEIDNNKLGVAIQYFRETYQVSQFRLCKGLCSIATLSRIESGERDVDSLLLETILERLGKTPNQFELILTDLDYKFYQKREALKSLIKNKQIEEVESLLNTYEKMAYKKGNVHKQFIMRCKALLNELQGGEINITLDLLMQAITYTVPGFKTNKIQEYYLSNSELNIIIDIIQRLISMGDRNRAKELIYQVLSYLDDHNSMEKSDILYPKVAIIACKLLIKNNDYAEALKLCNKGLDKTKGTRKLDFLGDLYLIKAQAMEAIQKVNNVSKPEEYLKLYLQAYYIYEFCDEIESANNIKQHLQEEYQWECIG